MSRSRLWAVLCLLWIVPARAQAAEDIVRVRILFTSQPVRLNATGPYQFQLRQGGKKYSSASATNVRAMRGTLVFGHQSFKGDVLVTPVSSSDTMSLNGRHYRGRLVFHPLGRGRYDVVEYAELEEYLYGVLPKEVETNWPLDALKAQAVVSRTYAMSNRTQGAKARFDLSDGVFDQVYGGRDVESPASNQAVEETRGEVLLDAAGKPIQAFFHSSCGGCTEMPQYVWKSATPSDVFASVPDAFCQGDPHYTWHFDISYAAMRERLRRAGIGIKAIKKMTILQQSPSGRAQIIGLETSKGTFEISGNRFRIAMGADKLRSLLFVTMKQTKRGISIDGRGWGHGVGLCQWGAHGRALAGQTYKQILETYYPKATLSKL